MLLRDKSFQWKRIHLLVVLVVLLGGLLVVVIVISRDPLKKEVEQVGGTYDSYNLDLGRGSSRSLIPRIGSFLYNQVNGVERSSVNIGFSSKSSVTDEWFKRNSSRLRMIPLHWLSLRTANISDKSVKALSGQPMLSDLNLEKTHISDESVESLLTLSNLHNLNLIDTEVTEAGLIRLLAHSKLRRLEIDGELLSDALVSSLNSSPQVLDLTLKSASSEVIARTTQLKHVTALSLSDVTDEDLPQLKQLQQLKILVLVDCSLSESSIELLEAAMPNVTQHSTISIDQTEKLGLYEQMEAQEKLLRMFYLVVVVTSLFLLYIAFTISKTLRRRWQELKIE